MGMPIKLSVFEALTEAGVTPDKARAVERELENAIQTGQDAVRAEMRDQVMTKSDGAELKSRHLRLVSMPVSMTSCAGSSLRKLRLSGSPSRRSNFCSSPSHPPSGTIVPQGRLSPLLWRQP